MDNVQNCGSYINVPSLQTYRSGFAIVPRSSLCPSPPIPVLCDSPDTVVRRRALLLRLVLWLALGWFKARFTVLGVLKIWSRLSATTNLGYDNSYFIFLVIFLIITKYIN
jgi:hypothetical protein